VTAPLRGRLRALAAAAAAALVLAACQERLTAPAECPSLCPGGSLDVRDTLVLPMAGRDSTFPPEPELGYADRELASSIRLATTTDGDAFADVGVIRFVPRDTSFLVRDTLRLVTSVDSVFIGFTVQALDTTANGLQIGVYRFPDPAAAASGITWTQTQAVLQPQFRIATIAIPDTLERGETVQAEFRGAALDLLSFPGPGRDTLAVALVLEGPQATGLRVAGISSTGVPSFRSHVKAVQGDSTYSTVIARTPAFTSFVSPQADVPADPALLAIGGVPAKRSIVRFELTPFLRDSIGIVRAVLELTPAEPVVGLGAVDPVVVRARGLLVDLGAKSPLVPETSLPAAVDTAVVGAAGLLELDVTRLVRTWQTVEGRPAALQLNLAPEGGSFGRALFGSTRAGIAPRLRITYATQFPFEAP
jgi:hypothetical protein